MIDPVARKRLEKIIRLANAKTTKIEAHLANLRPGPGTLLLLPGVDPAWLWAGLTWHRESEDMLFCVPADDAPFAGAADLETDEASLFVTLRCGYGIWFSRPLLDKTIVVGNVSAAMCDAALDRIVRMVSGRLIHSPDDDDGLEDLEDWYERLAQVASEVRVLRDNAEQEAEIRED